MAIRDRDTVTLAALDSDSVTKMPFAVIGSASGGDSSYDNF